MKYILMCGGNYPSFKKRKQLAEVSGEVLIERTIRLLKENGINDIVICTNGKDFDYLGLPILMQDNDYIAGSKDEGLKSKACWLNAYYLIEEPCCYIHGDVYFSEEAIKTIVETEVKDTMFFCIRDLQDGRPTGVNAKGREPLAYKVQNYKLFRNAIDDLLRMVDEGVYKDKIPPFSWHLYRYINGLEYVSDNLGFINNIFETKGDYIVIDDYTTDVDSIKDVERIETMLKIMKGEIKMVKVEIIESTRFGRFNELKNLVRKNPGNNEKGIIYVGDTAECTEELAEYLTKTNPMGRPFAKVIEVIPEKAEPKEEKKTTKKTATKTTAKKKTTTKKK